MKQARSPSARTEEWTFRGTASILPEERQMDFPRNGKWTSRGTANGLPEERQAHFLRNGNHTS